ncbi:MAG: indole-3-glycerol phosphate synthase [Saprospiraceae bacterium]|jgi:indole-3-glycerol phosphate synthase
MNILDKIVSHKKKEVISRKELYPTPLLEKSTFFESPVVSMSRYIKREDKSGIIAEFKRRSPSKPYINLYADVEEVSVSYMQAGASALSILTDNHFFGGKSEDLTIARRYNFCPILRKDFIIDEYQIIEARSMGADAILLISEILTKEEVKSLTAVAHSLNLEVLMEIHSERQLGKYDGNINLIGVNNRNLDTFVTDIQSSKDLFDKLPNEVTKISESGIHTIEDIHELKTIGYDGFLIGERFMSTANPGEACQSFIQQIEAAELW